MQRSAVERQRAASSAAYRDILRGERAALQKYGSACACGRTLGRIGDAEPAGGYCSASLLEYTRAVLAIADLKRLGARQRPALENECRRGAGKGGFFVVAPPDSHAGHLRPRAVSVADDVARPVGENDGTVGVVGNRKIVGTSPVGIIDDVDGFACIADEKRIAGKYRFGACELPGTLGDCRVVECVRNVVRDVKRLPRRVAERQRRLRGGGGPFIPVFAYGSVAARAILPRGGERRGGRCCYAEGNDDSKRTTTS